MVLTGDYANLAKESPFQGAGPGPTGESQVRPQDHLLDCWSFYDFKETFLIPGRHPFGSIVPGWVPPEHRRRLQSYMLLDSYYKLCARRWLMGDEETRRERREYGDVLLVVETA